MRQSIPRAIAILVLCCTTSACDDSDDVTVSAGPSAFVNRLDFVGLTADVLTRQSILQPNCPTLPPFSVPFIVNVRAGAIPVTLTEVRVQATDPFRIQSPPTIFDSSSLTRNFGSATIDSFAARAFPFTFGFGCGMQGIVVLNLAVTTVDSSGATRVTPLAVSVR